MSPDVPVVFRADHFRLLLLADERPLLHLACAGELRLPDFSPAAEPLAAALGPDVYARSVLLDLDGVSYLDTSGLSWLVHCHERCEQAGGRLVLCRVPPQAGMLLRLLHLDRVLQTAATVEAGQRLAQGERP
jgi:anti-sigma B factor antagonist